MIGKTFSKVSSTKHEELFGQLGDDLSIELLKYCYKSFEMLHRGDSAKDLQVFDCRKALSYVNAAFPHFYSSGICATAFERGDPVD